MPQVFMDIPAALLAAAGLIGFFAGMIKGAVGFAMPLIVVSSVSLFIDPRLVVGGLVVPILVSNVSQMLRQGPRAALAALIEFRLFLVPLLLGIFIAAQFMRGVSPDSIFLFLGLSVTALSLIQLSGWQPRIPARGQSAAAIIMGSFAGAMGGFAGTWGPPTVLYLLALDTQKAKQVTVQGVLFGFGGVMLMLGHLRSGVLSWYSLPLSLFMTVPVLLGMFAGYRIQDRIDQALFRRATLAVLVIAGLNLIRRALLA